MVRKYPLGQLVRIKRKRVEEAEKLLKQRRRELANSREKLKAFETERDTTLQHKQAKINQLRDALDQGHPSIKIESIRLYIKTVEEDLQQRELQVRKQSEVVQEAQRKQEAAHRDWLKKQHDVEKMDLHRQEWDKEISKETAQEERLENDELGTAMHTHRKRK